MSTKLQQLRERRNAKAQEAQALNNKYPADQRMPKGEADQLDGILNEIEAIDAEIQRMERAAQLAGDNMGQNELRDRHTVDPNRQENRDGNAALRAYLGGGLMALTDEQRRTMLARQNDDIRQAMNLNGVRNAMSTGVPTEGGYTTAPEYYASLEAAMRAYGGIFSAVDTIRTGTGTAMNFPTTDATTEEGEIVGEGGPATGQDTAFGNIALSVYRYSSKKIALPWELIQDSFIDIEGYINELLAMRLGRIGSKHLTNGTGTNQPKGIVTAATLGKAGATGSTTSVGYDDLVDTEHSVDPIYRGMPGVGWMFHDNTLKAVRKIKDGNGRPIFVPGYEAGTPGGAPDSLMGKPIVINQDMPTMAANAKSILYGAFKKYKRRLVMDLTIFRMTDSAFTLNGQVGFVAFNRQGGNLIDAGGAVKYFQNSAT
ncbi:phage major capsid protein [uncultured Azohydromonas sp.]|jgi:phage major capsid protein, HK97 family|uniref:phage major capsid protein n=1 Tax=uncultured Azohydromonas sp. TaxID=487342 RepID=UPI0026360E89|nr:phage major capsid protein [uncultured Azohydromonas sp.]